MTYAEVEKTLDHPDLIDEEGLLFACILDGEGGARFIGWKDIGKWKHGDGPLWVHLDHKHPHAREWLEDQSGLTLPTAEALLATETRPRVFRGKRGIVAILRGVNHKSNENIDDMVAIRIWSEGKRVITLRHRRLHTPSDILEQMIEQRDGPKTAPQLFERLISKINEYISDSIQALDDDLDNLESHLDVSKATIQRRQLSVIRQNAVVLRRYLSPQKEALSNLTSDPPVWLDDTLRPRLRETMDRVSRYVEELDSTRERALVVKDDITNQLSESTNNTLYMLAIISGIFLPLAFLTGLLGINVGGMPGVEADYAFWVFCVLLVVCLFVELLIFRKLKWF